MLDVCSLLVEQPAPRAVEVVPAYQHGFVPSLRLRAATVTACHSGFNVLRATATALATIIITRDLGVEHRLVLAIIDGGPNSLRCPFAATGRAGKVAKDQVPSLVPVRPRCDGAFLLDSV